MCNICQDIWPWFFTSCNIILTHYKLFLPKCNFLPSWRFANFKGCMNLVINQLFPVYNHDLMTFFIAWEKSRFWTILEKFHNSPVCCFCSSISSELGLIDGRSTHVISQIDHFLLIFLSWQRTHYFTQQRRQLWIRKLSSIY